LKEIVFESIKFKNTLYAVTLVKKILTNIQFCVIELLA